MEDKRKRSNEPNLDLCLKTPSEIEPIKKIPTLEEAMNFEFKHGSWNVDLKKLRRTVSNRLSAQRSRLRRIEYTTELEKKIKDLQDTIALVGPKIKNVKDNKKKMELENELLQEQLNRVTNKSNLSTARTEELKLELKRLKKLEKSQKNQEHVKIEGQSSNSYDDDEEEESVAEIDMDQYLNFDAINFYPLK